MNSEQSPGLLCMSCKDSTDFITPSKLHLLCKYTVFVDLKRTFYHKTTAFSSIEALHKILFCCNVVLILAGIELIFLSVAAVFSI